MDDPKINGLWFCFKCEPNCGEIGWFIMPLNVNFGEPLSPILIGYCPRGHETTILGEDVGKIWPSQDQKTPAWYPVKPN
jgi:hypothetical protein